MFHSAHSVHTECWFRWAAVYKLFKPQRNKLKVSELSDADVDAETTQVVVVNSRSVDMIWLKKNKLHLNESVFHSITVNTDCNQALMTINT